jgi:virginiamycin B lyase
MATPRTQLARNASIAAAVLLVLLAAGRLTSAGLGTSEDDGPALGKLSPAPPETTEPPSPVISAVMLRAGRHRLAFGAGAVWVANDNGTVNRIDPRFDHIVADTIRVTDEGAGLRGAAVGAGALWVPIGNPGALARIDVATDRVTATIPLGRPLRDPVGVAAGDGAVWVTCCAFERTGRRTGKLIRVDPASAKVTARITLPSDPLAVATAPGAVWVATEEGGAIRVDPASNRVAEVFRGGGRGAAQTLAVGADGVVWLANPGDGSVIRLDPSAPDRTRAQDLAAATQLAVGPEEVWAVATNDQVVVRLGQADGVATGRFPVSFVRSVQSIAYGAGSVWAVQGAETLLRLDPEMVER